MRFFRIGRRKIIMKDDTKKYFKYAFGEIVLIVLGILIALQINNFNESLKNQEKENVLLKQLRQEFSNDLKQLNDKNTQRNNIIYSCKRLLEYADNDVADNPDSIILFLQRSIFMPTFNSNSENFFESRDISLLQNDSLRSLLADWPTQVKQLLEEEKQWVDYRDQNYLPFLTENFQARNVYNGIQEDLEMMELVFLDKSRSFDNRINGSKVIEDPNLLLENKDLEDHLAFAIMIQGINNIQASTLSQHIEKILEQIEN